VPTTRASRMIAAPAQDLWELLCDPHHQPRWWPRVTRVEDVEADAFTQVMRTRKGKLVRADYSVRREDEQQRLTWVQRIAGTPFASVLKSSEIDLRLESLQPPDASATAVTIELRQEMAVGSARYSPIMSLAPRFGGPLVRRAAAATLAQALDGLERISG
jgi:uncharacterized protein YndB with AHSA1/START domain